MALHQEKQDFFCLSYCIYIHSEIVLSIFQAKREYIGWLKGYKCVGH